MTLDKKIIGEENFNSVYVPSFIVGTLFLIQNQDYLKIKKKKENSNKKLDGLKKKILNE